MVRTYGSILLPLAGITREVVSGQQTDIGGTQQIEGLVVGTTEADFKLISVLS